MFACVQAVSLKKIKVSHNIFGSMFKNDCCCHEIYKKKIFTQNAFNLGL